VEAVYLEAVSYFFMREYQLAYDDLALVLKTKKTLLSGFSGGGTGTIYEKVGIPDSQNMLLMRLYYEANKAGVALKVNAELEAYSRKTIEEATRLTNQAKEMLSKPNVIQSENFKAFVWLDSAIEANPYDMNARILHGEYAKRFKQYDVARVDYLYILRYFPDTKLAKDGLASLQSVAQTNSDNSHWTNYEIRQYAVQLAEIADLIESYNGNNVLPSNYDEKRVKVKVLRRIAYDAISKIEAALKSNKFLVDSERETLEKNLFIIKSEVKRLPDLW
jgi:hypothetical protein